MGMQVKLGYTSCPECKESVHKDANICPHCRTQLSEHPVWKEQKANASTGCVVAMGFLGVSLAGSVMYVSQLLS